METYIYSIWYFFMKIKQGQSNEPPPPPAKNMKYYFSNSDVWNGYLKLNMLGQTLIGQVTNEIHVQSLKFFLM